MAEWAAEGDGDVGREQNLKVGTTDCGELL